MVFKKIIFQNSLMANETPSKFSAPFPYLVSCILSGCRDPNQPVWRRRRRLWLQPHSGQQLRAQQGHRGAVQWGRGGEGGGGLRWRRNARVSPQYIEILQASGGKSMTSLNLISPWNHFRRQWFYQLMEWWLETHSSSRCKVKKAFKANFVVFLDKVPCQLRHVRHYQLW